MKILKISIALALIILAAAGWYYYSQDEPRKSQAPEAVYSNSDSVEAPKRPSLSAQEDTLPQPVGEKLAPGTALVKGTVLSVDYNDDSPANMTVRIDEVRGYGSATSPIGTKSELDVDVQNVIRNNAVEADKLKEGAVLFMVITQQKEMLSRDSSGGDRWRLVELKS